MNKKISLKNYFVLFIIMFFSIILIIYILNLYKQYNEEQLKIPVISSVLREINYEDLSSVVSNRDFLIVYMCSSSETKCRNFEINFKDYIIKNDLTEEMVYLNIGYSSDEKDILNRIYNEYKHEDLLKKLYNYPSIVIFSEGKIIDLFSPSKELSNINTLVEEFLGGYIYD